jgi:hypothetical protein
MALTPLQRDVCRLIAANRIASGESYVAGGAALNEALATSRVSRDLDLFHDTDEALDTSWRADRRLLEDNGYSVRPLRERASFVEAEVSRADGVVMVEWARDSAYRFFPLVESPDLGLVLHPFDLATNKVLALVGRLEVRDWVDVIECDSRLQPFGYLAWAACGKDPGFSPASLLEHASRSGRYSADEIASLAFDGPAPDPGDLSRRWHALLAAARETVALLPAEESGKCALESGGRFFKGDAASLRSAIASNQLRFHAGRIRGALPTVGGG